MANLPQSSQSDSMDSLTVTREQFRLAKKDELEYLAQAFGNVSGSYTTETINPTAVTLQGTPTLATAAEPAAADSSLRLVNTRWVKQNAASTGTTPPATPVRGQVWIDTSQDPPQMNVWDDTPPPGAWSPVSSTVPPASETVAGIAELATQAEVDLGTDDERIVTPLKLISLLTGGGTSTSPGFLPLVGGNLTGGVTATERTVTAGAFDLATGNFWTAAAIAIPNPTNAVAGMSGLIRLTAAPTGWGGNFSTAPAPTVFPSIVPFYCESPTSIRLGRAVGVA